MCEGHQKTFKQADAMVFKYILLYLCHCGCGSLDHNRKVNPVSQPLCFPHLPFPVPSVPVGLLAAVGHAIHVKHIARGERE